MKSAAKAIFGLHYAAGSTRRRRRLSPLTCEFLELLLALSLLAAILVLMTAGLVAIILQHWWLAAPAFAAIPVVIILCFEGSEHLRRTRERLL